MNKDKFSLLSVPLESCVLQEEHKLEVHSDYAGKDHMELPHHNKIKYVDLKMKIKKHEVLFLGYKHNSILFTTKVWVKS